MRLLALSFLVASLSSCAVLGGITPKSNVNVTRSATDGKGRIVASEIVELPAEWWEGALEFELEREYYSPSDTQLEVDSIKSEKVTIKRNSSVDGAAGIAGVRAQQTSAMVGAGIAHVGELGMTISPQFFGYLVDREAQRTIREQNRLAQDEQNRLFQEWLNSREHEESHE